MAEKLDMIKEIYESSPIPTLITDDDLFIMWANQAMRKAYSSTTYPEGLLAIIPEDGARALTENKDKAVVYNIPILDGHFSCHPLGEGARLIQVVMRSSYEISLEKFKSCDTAISGIAGQLRKDVFNIFMGVSTAARIAEINREERLVHAVDLINESAYAILRFSNSFSEYLRYVSASEDMVMQDTDVDSLLNDITAMAAIITNSIGVPLNYSEAGKSVIVNLDEKKFMTIMFHLISNSCRFTRELNKIEVKLETRDDKAVITVVDKGIGIADKYVKKVFTPFFSVDSITDSPMPNVGLGLSLVQMMAFDMGGTVALSSVDGEGTTVCVTLPLSEQQSGMKFRSHIAMADMLRDRFSLLHVILSDSCGVPMP